MNPITNPAAHLVPDLKKNPATSPATQASGTCSPSILCLICEYGCTCPQSWWC